MRKMIHKCENTVTTSKLDGKRPKGRKKNIWMTWPHDIIGTRNIPDLRVWGSYEYMVAQAINMTHNDDEEAEILRLPISLV